MSKLAQLAKARSQRPDSSVPRSIAILDKLTNTTTPVRQPRKRKPSPEVKQPKPQPTPTITFGISVDDSILLSQPREDVSVFWCRNSSTTENHKRRRLDSIYQPITNLSIEKITKAKENFTQPSPDDVVLNAQKQAFEGVANLKIAPPKQTKPFKKVDISKALLSPDYAKPRKSFVVIGHVDAGKSTLMGDFCMILELLMPRQLTN